MGTLTYSTQMTNNLATPPVINAKGSGLYRIPWNYTVATTALVTTDVVQVCKIPAGSKVILPLSVMKLSADQGASTQVDIGHAAYVDKNGATVAAVADALVNGYVASSTAVNSLIPATAAPVGTSVNTLGVMDFTDAVQDVIITLTCLDAGGTFDGDIADVYNGYFVVEYQGK